MNIHLCTYYLPLEFPTVASHSDLLIKNHIGVSSKSFLVLPLIIDLSLLRDSTWNSESIGAISALMFRVTTVVDYLGWVDIDTDVPPSCTATQ